MSRDINLNNLPAMSVDGMVKLLSEAYINIIKNGSSVTLFPSVMLWGPPGVGKSQGVRQIADNIRRATGKKVKVTDVRLLLFNPIDLRGIPTANEDKTLAVWLKPQIFQMDDSSDTVNLLLLDEISAAPQSVQAAAYQITLDRVIGEHRLPDNCIVLAAGNRVTDKSVAYKMPKALANRLLHIEITDSFESWKKWAIASGINEMVIAYLSFCRSHLSAFDVKSEELAFPTPRSWEMVSNILNNVSEDLATMFPLIQGLVGAGVATEFVNWCKVFGELPDIEDIFDGKTQKIPGSIDGIYALVSSMSSYAAAHRTEMDRIANSIRYASLLPPDFSVVLMKDYMCIEPDYKLQLLKIPEFSRWMQSKGKLLTGAGV